MDIAAYLKYRKTPTAQKRERANTARFLTVAEMLTAGHLHQEQTAEYLDILQFEMGAVKFALWLCTFDPPLHDRADEEIRRTIFTKLQSELRT